MIATRTKVIDRKKLSTKAKELLLKAGYIQANCDNLVENKEYWELYKDFCKETNFVYTKGGLEPFKVACLQERRFKSGQDYLKKNTESFL